jgi:hypothetical protein
MKTGDGPMDTSAFEKTAFDMFLPVMESATVMAAHYAKACGRDCVVATDMKYGLMYAARNVAGKHIGTMYPEIYEDEDEDEDEEDSGSDEETEDPDWSEYTGTEDDMAVKMNECARTWAEWIPENPTEDALKSAVDSIGGQ